MFNSYYEKHLFNLPKTWTIVRFGDIVSIRRGASPRPIKEHLTTREDGINWIKIGDTRPGDIYITETKQKILKESAALSVYLEKGTLVLSNSMSFGRPYILNIDGCIHDGWLAIEIYNNTIDKEFLQIILQGYMWYFKNKATGTGVDNLNINRVQGMPFALPPLAEQRRILFALRSYHKLLSEISDSYCAINKTVSLVKYKILDLFFGKNSRYKSYYKYEENSLSNIATLITKGSTPTTYGFEYLSEGINFIKVENVNDYCVQHNTIKQFISETAHEFQKRSQLEKDDLLISIAGTLGRICLIKDEDLPANTNQAFAIVRGYTQTLLPDYLKWFVTWYVDSKSQQLGHGGGMNNLTLGEIKALKIMYPVSKDEQQQIIDKVNACLEVVSVIEGVK